MAQSNSERQKIFKARRGDNFKRLDILLPIAEAELLTSNSKEAGLSKSDYIVKLLHGNVSGNESNLLGRVLEELTGLGFSINKIIDELRVLPDNVTRNDKLSITVSQKPDSAVNDKPLPDNVTGYDGTTSLNKAVAELIGCSVKNTVKTSGVVKAARRELKISLKSKNLSPSMKVRIYGRVKKMTQAQDND